MTVNTRSGECDTCGKRMGWLFKVHGDVIGCNQPGCKGTVVGDKRPKNIRLLPIITDKDLDPDVMLRLADGKLKHVVILGYDHDGEMFFSSNLASGPEVLWLLECARHDLIKDHRSRQ